MYRGKPGQLHCNEEKSLNFFVWFHDLGLKHASSYMPFVNLIQSCSFLFLQCCRWCPGSWSRLWEQWWHCRPWGNNLQPVRRSLVTLIFSSLVTQSVEELLGWPPPLCDFTAKRWCSTAYDSIHWQNQHHSLKAGAGSSAVMVPWRFKRKKTTGKKNGGTCNYQSQIQQNPIVIETYRFLKDVGFRGSNAECLTQSPAILQAVEAEQKQ